METLLQSIARERREKEEEVKSLQERLAVLYDDLARLDNAEAAMKGQSLTVSKMVKAKKVDERPQPKKTMTIKDMVLIVLKGHSEGLVALDILSEINARFNQSYVRTSLSPQLSRLKQSGKIEKSGKRWLLSVDK